MKKNTDPQFQLNLPQTKLKVRKPVLITAIALGSIIILSLMVFFGQQFVGKAISAPPTTTFDNNYAGAESIGLPIAAGKQAIFEVGANIGSAESVAYEFEVIYDTDLLTCSQVVPLFNDWYNGEFKRFTSEGGSLKFEHATIDFTKAITGGVKLAAIQCTAKQGITSLNQDIIRFNNFKVLNLATHQDIIQNRIKDFSGEAKCTLESCQISYPGECGADCVSGGFGGVDINNDGKINGQDAFIILNIAEANTRTECGGNEQAPCRYVKNFVCNDGSFRVEGYKGYTGGTGVCPFQDMQSYLGGTQ